MDSPFKELVVVTYNIRHGRGRDDVQDIDRTRLVLEQADAQLIGLQEVDCCNPWRSHNVDQSAYLASSLSMQHHFATGQDRARTFRQYRPFPVPSAQDGRNPSSEERHGRRPFGSCRRSSDR